MYRLTVLKNMKTNVNRVINITETVQTEVDFPKYTRDDFFYYKHYSFNHCISVSLCSGYGSIHVDYNNKGEHLFDKEISEAEFNRVKAKALAMLMFELQPTQEEEEKI